MKKKTKKLIKALEAKITIVDDRAKLVSDYINDMYEAQTKFFSDRLGTGTIVDYFKSI